MPLTEPVSALFTAEWARFQEGYAALVGIEQEEYLRAYRRSRASADGSTLISLPGATEIVRLSTPYQPSADEAREYYTAKRQKRAPDLPLFVRQELQRREAIKERIARSPEPAYAQGFGSILTAIDNVQDFMSTLSTTGRLALWGLPQATQLIFPGASAGTARALAEVAARRAAATTAATFAETVAARAAAGNLVARLALADAALMAAAQREAVSHAAASAYRLAFSRATLGLAGRLAARFVPVLGWIVLASDLLNLLSFLAMVATPTYALLCSGPQAALAAGVPAAVFKQALKRETWRAHNLNPFSRRARAARALRAAGRLPGFSNLIEVAQTTDQLFGIGISLGGLVGLMNGLSFGLYEWSQGRTVSFTGPPEIARNMGSLVATGPQADPALQRMLQQAGGIVATAPAVLAVQEHFTEEEHMLVLLALREATALLRRQYPGARVAELIPAALDARWRAPLSVAPDTVMWGEATGRDLQAGARWWFDGAPVETTGLAYVEHHAAAIPSALRDYLMPRRATPGAALYGAVFGELGEAAWLLVENDPDLFRFELTTDARLVSSLCEDGLILAPNQREADVWRWWLAARAELEAREETSLRPGRWLALAREHGVSLIPLLPATAPVPPVWDTGAGPFEAPAGVSPL